MGSLASKLVGEIISVEFDFTEFLPLGETITSSVVTSTVVSGVDTYASRMVLGSTRQSGAIATQWIAAGIAGVIYALQCDAIFSNGDEFSVIRRLAVLPGQGTSAPFPPGYPTPVVLTGDAPNGFVGSPYSYSYTISGGFFPYTSALIGGAYPTGMSMPTFTLGTLPTQAGTFDFVIEGEDSYGQTDTLPDTVIIYGSWIAGPVSVNGALGGSQDYYKITGDISDWSSAPIALPLGRTNLIGISTANNVVFMAFTATTAVYSLDAGITWQETDTVLPAHPVYWNGNVYVCFDKMSSDLATWTTIPNLSGTLQYMVARSQDGLLVCAYSSGTPHFEYSFDEGVTWTSVDTVYPGEGISSLIVSSEIDRINYSIGSPSTINVVGVFTDDLFVTQDFYGLGSAGVYQGKYGCSRLIQDTFESVAVLSQDGGWSWLDVVTSFTNQSEFFYLDFGANTWGMLDRLTVGSPNTTAVVYSTDGGRNWTVGDTLYGTTASIAYIGGPGDCTLYPDPTYALATPNELYTGEPGALEFLAEVNYLGGGPIFSDSGIYLMSCDVSGNPSVYKRSENGLGYEAVSGPWTSYLAQGEDYAFSYDDQYMVMRERSTTTFRAFRQVGGVFSEITMPVGTNISRRPRFHPSTNTMIMSHGSSSVVCGFLFSGDTISGPYNSASTGNFPMQMDFAREGFDLVLRTNTGSIKVLDVSDPATSIPVLATGSSTSANDGDVGIYFSYDGTSIITVTLSGIIEGYIHYRTWNGSAVGAATLIGTDSYRSLLSAITQDKRYLAIGGDVAAPYLTIYHLAADGTSILTSYDADTTGPVSDFLTWIGV